MLNLSHMNETSKTAQFRSFRSSLKLVAQSLNATAIHTSRMYEGEFRITDNADNRIEITVIYRNSERDGEQLTLEGNTVDKTSILSNLTANNLKKHISHRLLGVRNYFLEMEEDERRATAEDSAAKLMANKLDTALLSDDFTKATNVDDDYLWRSATHGTIKLARVSGTLNTERGYDFSYNVEFDLTLKGTAIEGKLDAVDFSGIIRPLRTLYTL